MVDDWLPVLVCKTCVVTSPPHHTHFTTHLNSLQFSKNKDAHRIFLTCCINHSTGSSASTETMKQCFTNKTKQDRKNSTSHKIEVSFLHMWKSRLALSPEEGHPLMRLFKDPEFFLFCESGIASSVWAVMTHYYVSSPTRRKGQEKVGDGVSTQKHYLEIMQLTPHGPWHRTWSSDYTKPKGRLRNFVFCWATMCLVKFRKGRVGIGEKLGDVLTPAPSPQPILFIF